MFLGKGKEWIFNANRVLHAGFRWLCIYDWWEILGVSKSVDNSMNSSFIRKSSSVESC